MVNICDQCSWVHTNEFATSTQKAKDLIRMAVAKFRLLDPLKEAVIDINSIYFLNNKVKFRF